MSPVFRTGKTGGNERGRLHPRGRAVLYKGSEGRAPAFPEGSPPGEFVTHDGRPYSFCDHLE